MLNPGDRLGDRFEITRAVAKGGMGAVFEALDTRLGRSVAIKTILPGLIREPLIRARFEREARATAALSHPGIVQVYDFDVTSGGLPFLVMEWIHGRSFLELLRAEHRLSPRRACSLMEQCLNALAAAHRAGIVHRDLKLGNLMLVDLSGLELVKVVDFGVAQLKLSTEYTRLTSTGQLVGTPSFMAPEQLRGEEVGPAADIYAAATVLYCLLTGQRPFSNGPDAILEVLQTRPPRADAICADIPRAMADVLERAMEKDPRARFASASEMAEALARAIANDEATDVTSRAELAALGLVDPARHVAEFRAFPASIEPPRTSIPRTPPSAPRPPTASREPAPAAPVDPFAIERTRSLAPALRDPHVAPAKPRHTRLLVLGGVAAALACAVLAVGAGVIVASSRSSSTSPSTAVGSATCARARACCLATDYYQPAVCDALLQHAGTPSEYACTSVIPSYRNLAVQLGRDPSACDGP